MTTAASQLWQILIEQTSPLEMIVFMFLVVVACLAVAASFYAVLMSVVWAVSLRQTGVGYRQVFFPSVGRLRDFAPEYVLTAGTSLLLAYTTIVRHALVERIKAISPRELFANDPEFFSRVGDSVATDLAQNHADLLGNLTVGEVIKPALESGRSEEIRGILVKYINANQELAFNTTPVFAAAGVLVTGHLLWLAYRRYNDLAESPEDGGSVSYGKTSKSIRVLAVCIALLLAAPTLAASAERLADSAMAVFEDADLPPEPPPADPDQPSPRDRIRTLIIQGTSAGMLGARLGDVEADLRDLDARLGDAEADLGAASDRLGAVDDSLAETAGTLTDHAGQLAALDSRLTAAEATVGDVATRVDGFASTLDDIASRLLDLETRLDGIDAARITRIEQSIQDLGGQVDGLGLDIADLTTRIAANETSIGALGSRIDTFDARFVEIEGTLQAVLEESRALAGRVATLIDRVASAEQSVEGLGARLGDLAARLNGFQSALEELGAAVQRAQQGVDQNARRHTETGYLMVSGVTGASFFIRGQETPRTVPAMVSLAPGEYTLIRPQAVGDDVSLSSSPDAAISRAIDPLRGAAGQQQSLTQQQALAQQLVVVVTVRADQATGVTLPWR